MLNVKTLTDTMSRMELPQLQQYAALHKNDPYIVTLALSIANQKKQMKMGQDGQAGMMPQPKVVDQQLAQMSAPPPQQMAAAPQQQMLPEDQGIGTLPAQNMQNFAGGGIVAFDEGGSTSPVGRFLTELTAQTPEQTRQAYVRNAIMRKKTALTEQGGLLGLRQQTPEQKEIYERTKAEIDYLQKLLNNPNYAPPASTTAPAAIPYDPATATRRSNFVDPNNKRPPPAASAVSADASAAPVTAAAPSVAAAATTPVDLMRGVKNLNTEPMTAEAAIAASNTFGTGSELTTGIEQLRKDAINTNEDVSKAYKEGLAALPKPGAEAEARLKQREAEDAVGKADAKAMAIFKAGLGMMAGTSQNAFENIGKGAMVGLEDYSASIKDFRKLAIERDKAYADIEAARNAAARDDFKASVGLQEKAAERLARVNEKGIEVTATLFKTNKDAASNIWNTGNTLASANARSYNETQVQANRSVFEQGEMSKREAANIAAALQRQREGDAAALQRTKMQVSAPTSEERILLNPALFKKKMELQTAATGMRGDTALRETWAKSYALQAQYPKVEDYLRAMGVIAPVNLPANTPVLP